MRGGAKVSLAALAPGARHIGTKFHCGTMHHTEEKLASALVGLRPCRDGLVRAYSCENGGAVAKSVAGLESSRSSPLPLLLFGLLSSQPQKAKFGGDGGERRCAPKNRRAPPTVFICRRERGVSVKMRPIGWVSVLYAVSLFAHMALAHRGGAGRSVIASFIHRKKDKDEVKQEIKLVQPSLPDEEELLATGEVTPFEVKDVMKAFDRFAWRQKYHPRKM